jgi:urea transport system permease protein
LARESIDLIRLDGAFPDGVSVDRLEAARDLGILRSAQGRGLLADLLAETDKDATPGKPPDAAARDAYQQSIAQIDRYQNWVGAFDCLKDGLSSGSILVLMALGLAIIFGQMGVINMAHGELMMIGAFTTYSMQQFFVHSLPAALFNWYFVAALPASFLVAAFCGYLIEMLVVRHLYGRPLETLLATFGISLILSQSVLAIYGYNIGVNSPTWLQDKRVEVMQDMVVPYNRVFLVVLCACCVLLFYFIVNYTPFGLRMRATMQNRDMAAAMGVNTRRIDGATFALGSGLAGIAGYGLTQIAGVSPDMGKNYIVESFLVVVTGGVGELAGTLYAGMGLGILNKVFEPLFGAVWGRVLVLIAIVLFIQRCPAGLFPPKGRHADV